MSDFVHNWKATPISSEDELGKKILVLYSSQYGTDSVQSIYTYTYVHVWN